MSWQTTQVSDYVIHVYPLGDTRPHLLPVRKKKSSICPCEPREEYNNGCVIYVHSSFDGREGLEWANELLNMDSRK